MNPLKQLQDYGQSVWLDFLARGFIAKGHLKKLVDEDGLAGVTSNPSIFEKAIAQTDEYDKAIARVMAGNDRAVGELYEGLAVADIKHAADVLRPVFDARQGADGFVSIEVSPYLANDTEHSLDEARRLWREVDRKNLMIKIPATPAGLPAIRTLIGEGINVNITLLFSQKVYEQVVEAYLCGLEALTAAGRDLDSVASVASFFVSRIDTAVDKLLDQKIAQANDPDEKARLAALKGKVAIANARLAYRRYQRRFTGERWRALAAKGAKPQRLLWASTGTKNKAYSDVFYVEELIGRDTINTTPLATLDAFRDHGKLRPSLEENLGAAEHVLDELARAGISLDAVTDKLIEDGVQLFADAADALLSALAKKRAALLDDRADRQKLLLPPAIDGPTNQAVETWRAQGNVRRLFRHDKTLWTNADENRWLGWLDCVQTGLDRLGEYQAFAQEVRNEGFTHALLLGMGGSSLGPEVLAQTFGHQPGWPKLRILDSTDPAQIRAEEAKLDLTRTLFIVSSKSGSTTEPNVLKDYFYMRAADAVGSNKVGGHFLAITDPGSALEATAKRDRFWRIFHGEPSIGGRYSVLSPFGLVPAAAAGIDVARLLGATRTMLRSCGPDVPPADNPAVRLGLAIATAAQGGRDKVTIIASPRLASFGGWAEQLIAESTGKNGKALIPVDGEPLSDPAVYGEDRFFIDLQTNSVSDPAHEAALAKLTEAGHSLARIVLQSVEHVGQEFFRFELAVAVAGAVLGINPFDQPDVEASKTRTRELWASFEKTGALPAEAPVCSSNTLEVYADERNAEALRGAGADGSVEGWIKAHLARLHHDDYAALLAYIARTNGHADLLQKLRLAVRDRRRVATCLEFGPRFLHSTGQAYKGGPNTGVFLQITADSPDDLPIPGRAASFGVVKAAQARGDFDVLATRGRRALRVHLKGKIESALGALDTAIRGALA